MNKSSRKRIVINLDQSSGAQPNKQRARRWPKVLALLAVLIIVVVVIAAAGGYLWWRHYQTTPSYSLALILDAAQRDDMAKQLKEFSAKSTPKPFFIVALTVPSLVKIDTKGDIAQVTAKIQDRTI